MAVSMKSLSSSQEKIVDKIITCGNKIGSPEIVIETVIHIANAESSFNGEQTNGSYSGLFQYGHDEWKTRYDKFVKLNHGAGF